MWRRLLPSGPPGPLFHATILTCQTSGLAFGLNAYLSEGKRQESARSESNARSALDRVQAYFNARNPELAILELEKGRAQCQPTRRRSWLARTLGGVGSGGGSGVGSGGSGGNGGGSGGVAPSDGVRVSADRGWADVWIEKRVSLDSTALQMELNRVVLKNLWYLAKQAWEGNPEQRGMMRTFFFDAPLNASLAQRCLHICEAMDRARFQRRGCEYERPTIYPFIEQLYLSKHASVHNTPSKQGSSSRTE